MSSNTPSSQSSASSLTSLWGELYVDAPSYEGAHPGISGPYVEWGIVEGERCWYNADSGHYLAYNPSSSGYALYAQPDTNLAGNNVAGLDPTGTYTGGLGTLTVYYEPGLSSRSSSISSVSSVSSISSISSISSVSSESSPSSATT